MGANTGLVDIAKFRAEREQLKARIAKLDRLISAWEDVNPTEAGTGDRLDYKGRVRGVLTPNRAMSINQILAALQERGTPVTTADPYRTIYKMLRASSKDFDRRGSKWQLRKDAVKEGGN